MPAMPSAPRVTNVVMVSYFYRRDTEDRVSVDLHRLVRHAPSGLSARYKHSSFPAVFCEVTRLGTRVLRVPPVRKRARATIFGNGSIKVQGAHSVDEARGALRMYARLLWLANRRSGDSSVVPDMHDSEYANLGLRWGKVENVVANAHNPRFIPVDHLHDYIRRAERARAQAQAQASREGDEVLGEGSVPGGGFLHSPDYEPEIRTFMSCKWTSSEQRKVISLKIYATGAMQAMGAKSMRVSFQALMDLCIAVRRCTAEHDAAMATAEAMRCVD